MSVSLGLKPLNSISNGTPANPRTGTAGLKTNLFPTGALFLSTCAATLTIWNTGPLADQFYECCVFFLTGWIFLARRTALPQRFALSLAALTLWGFAQFLLGSTEDRSVTLRVALQYSALAAAAVAAYSLWEPSKTERYLEILAWFGLIVAVVGVTAYYTSPHQVLWLIDAPYPDVWGPFLSRNNFAQSLELLLPAALWLAFRKPNEMRYWSIAAAMLAAGLVSASRAGAILMCLEAVTIFFICGSRRIARAAAFAAVVTALAAIAGAGTLIGRLQSANPLADRDHIYRSTARMIEARPLQGYGLGTFVLIYPEFAEFDSGYRIEHAHNDWLEWAAEGGIGFACIWAALAIPAAFQSLRYPWSLGIAALFLHAFVDFPFARIGIAAWAFVLLGAAAKTHHIQFRKGESREIQASTS